MNLIKIVSPFRRFRSFIYSSILAYYLGKTVIKLGEIDLWIINIILDVLIFNAKNRKTFQKEIMAHPWGYKIRLIEEVYNRKYKELIKTGVPLKKKTIQLEGNKVLGQIIKLLNGVKNDIRNPLAHSNFLLGYGNKYVRKLSYKRI